jgi:hypothetical protein
MLVPSQKKVFFLELMVRQSIQEHQAGGTFHYKWIYVCWLAVRAQASAEAHQETPEIQQIDC